MGKISDLDKFDRQLLELVRLDNMAPARVMAEKVGLSVSAVLRRLRRLRDDKIIVGDISLVAPALTGSALTMHVLVEMSQSGRRIMDNFAREIDLHPQVVAAWEVTGETDFVLKVQVNTMEEYDRFTRTALSEEKGVRTFKTFIAIRPVIADDLSRRPLLDF